MKLTQASISRLKADKADAVYYDDDLPGFGIRIRAGVRAGTIRAKVMA